MSPRIGQSTRIVAFAAVFCAPFAWMCTNAFAAVSLDLVGTYSKPVYVTSDPHDAGRLFVVEKGGRIKLTQGGTTKAFLNISSQVVDGGERGLLSMAFAPDYATSGRFYIFYNRSGSTDDVGDLQLDEFIGTGNHADPASQRHVLTIDHSERANHNGGQLQFGPDGYLYISTGDGGGAGDPNENAQNTESLLGKILRIDPRQAGGSPYTVPVDNPFVGTTGADEIWSYGLRNPWRFSFDRNNGALIIGDVGQASWEEVDYEPRSAGAGRGDNFGWDCREGRHNFEFDPACGLQTFTEPIFEYSSGANNQPNCSITGGYRVRDRGLGNLYGRYVYTDYCAGQLRSLKLAQPNAYGGRSEGVSVAQPSSFGQDAAKRIYVASLTGPVYRLVLASSGSG